jgi:multiple sugar transport system ATP-binding protein
MDEPLSNLDAKLRVQARAEISKLHHRLGTTFIYVTHDQVEAMTMGTRIAVLKDGILQQCDTPQELYDYPANVFVGGFIGSPAMNFFDATLIENNGEMTLDCRDFQISLPEERRDMYRAYLGKEVIMGVRPEHIHDPEFTPPGIKPALVESKVDVTELMGNEVITYLETEHTSFLGRFDPRTNVKVGMTKTAAFDLSRMHLFDKDTEKAIR